MIDLLIIESHTWYIHLYIVSSLILWCLLLLLLFYINNTSSIILLRRRSIKFPIHALKYEAFSSQQNISRLHRLQNLHFCCFITVLLIHLASVGPSSSWLLPDFSSQKDLNNSGWEYTLYNQTKEILSVSTEWLLNLDDDCLLSSLSVWLCWLLETVRSWFISWFWGILLQETESESLGSCLVQATVKHTWCST